MYFLAIDTNEKSRHSGNPVVEFVVNKKMYT